MAAYSVSGVWLHAHYYVLHWFYAEVYHIELSCIKQVEAVKSKLVPDQRRHQEMNSRRRAVGATRYFFMFYFPRLLTGKNFYV